MPAKNNLNFEISERKILLRVFDILFALAGLYIVGKIFSFDYFEFSKTNKIWIVILIIYLSIFGTLFEIYDLQKSSKLETIFGKLILAVSVTVLFYLLTPFYTPILPENRLQIFYFFLAIASSIFLWRWFYIAFISSPRFYKRIILIGEVSNIKNILKTFNDSDSNYEIVGFVNCEEVKEDGIIYKGLKEFKQEELTNIIKAENISEIIIATYNSENISTAIYHDLIHLLEKGFAIKEYTQVYEDLTNRIPVEYVGRDFYKYFPFSRSNQNRVYLFFNRLFDIIFSFIAILIGLVLLPIILLGNLIANRGKLFYIQQRVGKNSKLFKIYKLRTMIENAEAEGAKWATKKDKRVTPFGRILRRMRIDEIPQCINILKGEMSLIGPRPERPYFVDELSKIIPFYETRHIIKPGLSGWAQVNLKYGETNAESLTKLQYDLYYIKHRSFFLDINIAVKTLSTIIFFRGQ